MTIIQIPSPHKNQLGTPMQKRWIILHGSAGGSSAQGVAAWFQDATSMVSSHYIVGQDGTIVQCVPESEDAWSNGGISGMVASGGIGLISDGIYRDPWWSPEINPNRQTLSIEIVKSSTDNSDDLSQIQQEALFGLVGDICARLQIPPREADAAGGITGHFSMDPINRAHCPGTLAWEALFAAIAGTAMTGEEKQTWQCLRPITINPDAAILKSWIAARRSGRHYGPPLEEEHSNGSTIVQQFSAARASYQNGTVSWHGASGVLL